MLEKKQVFKITGNLIVLLSLVFLVVFLTRKNQIIWLGIQNFPLFFLSVLCILLGFVSESMALRFFLKERSVELNFSQSIIATGKYILSKYIPGKLGVLIGKISYVTENTKVSPFKVFQTIFLFQILILLSSFLISVFPLNFFLKTEMDQHLLIVVITLLSLIILFQKKVQTYFLNMAGRILKKDLGTFIPARTILITIFILILCFLLWSTGFLLMSLSVGIELSFNAGFLFPLAALAGVVIIIAPGGLGVREGVIAAGLIFYGLPKEAAISLSAFSRIWFLTGEIIMFVIALVLSTKKQR